MDQNADTNSDLSISLLSDPFLSKPTRSLLKSVPTLPYTDKTYMGSIYLLISSSLGIGILSIPYVLHLSGFIFGILTIFLGLMITYFSCYCLIEVSSLTNRFSFFGIGEYLYNRRFGKICEGCLCLSCYIIFIYYISFLGSLPNLASKFHAIDLGVFDNEIMWMGIFTVLILPIAYSRWIFFLVHTSKLTILGGIVLIGIIIYETCTIRDDKLHRFQIAFTETPFYNAHDLSAVLNPFATVILAFDCQGNVLAVFEDLKDRSSNKALKLVGYSLSIVNIFYLILGIFGYILFYREDFPDNLLYGKYGSGDLAVLIVMCIIEFFISYATYIRQDSSETSAM